jgi:hypothetical protein
MVEGESLEIENEDETVLLGLLRLFMDVQEEYEGRH